MTCASHRFTESRAPVPAVRAEIAAAEIGELARRILALAPVAGLYVGIKIEPAKKGAA